MGLDMYLNRHNYIMGKDDSKVAEVTSTDYDGTTITKRYNRVKYVIQEVGYWRKANAIHKWFVDTVQDGKDDCKPYYVTEDDLKALKEVCLKALEKKKRYLELYNKLDEASNKELQNIKDELDSILPTQSGFFFGSTSYDEWYFKDLEDTVKIIDKIFEEDPKFIEEYYYHSSW